MIESVGFQHGWHVLDAGCGGGSFIPLIAKLVGKHGHITGIDVSAENIDTAKLGAKNAGFDQITELRIGSCLEIPYPDNSFDGVWCANVVQYLSREETLKAFAEFARVCRPGGIVAIKEFDLTMLQFYPMNPELLWREISAARTVFPPFERMLLIPELYQLMKDVGFMQCWQRTTVMERRQPLRNVERQFISAVLQLHTANAIKSNISIDDVTEWKRLADVDNPSHIMHREDFYFRAGQALIVGQVTSSANTMTRA
jgi:ubiquinone/menaquinone biosynthesis C-methylase UbiE